MTTFLLESVNGESKGSYPVLSAVKSAQKNSPYYYELFVIHSPLGNLGA